MPPTDAQLNKTALEIQKPVAANANVANKQLPNDYRKLRNVGNGDPNAVVNAPAFSGGMRYPLDLGKYYMSFGFSAYYRPVATGPSNFIATGSAIGLPIPNSLVDSYSMDYQTEEGGAAGPAQQALTDVLNKATGTDSTQQSGQTTGGFLASLGAALAANKASGGPGGQAAMQALGVAANPFLTLAFKGIGFKEYEFKWKFMPQSAEESNIVFNIINEFKRHSLPGLAVSGGVYTVPDIVQIKLHPDNYLYKFKPAVITNVSINYSPNPNPSFFRSTAAPTTLELSVKFKEIQLWTSSDIGGNLGNERIKALTGEK